MNKIARAVVVASFAVAIAGCVMPPEVARTSLQLQSFQAKEFETSKVAAFGSTLSVFQDLGYIVASADLETGFITAASPAGNKSNVWEVLAGTTSSVQTRATAFVEEIRPGFASIRLNFVEARRLSTMHGQTTDNDRPILEPKVYEAAFEKIGDAIFIRSGVR
ncbi:MAG TPA: hypothetical protein VEW08_13580 [Steroidobacteraceae bacterium]|nr:hypothetical protein [Steroidobacteraceae bacterium]